MSNKQNQPDPLRTEAEAQLIRTPATDGSPRPAEELLHELQVHQIELEMQNEALRQAQIAMEESRDRYVDLYELAPIGYLTLTREALIAEANLTGAALLGVERKKLLQRRFDHFVTPEDQDRWRQHFLRVVQHSEQQDCELSLKRGDGSVFHAHLDCLHVGGGSEPSVRIALAEITESKRMEEDQRSALLFMLEDLEAGRRKIEQSHQQWMAALDVVNDPIFLHDKQFRVLRCNKAYQQCAGIPFHEIIGQPYYEIFPKTGAPLACCLRVMEKAEAAADEEEMVVGDATYRSRTFSVYGEQGDYLHSVHILEDITGSRQAEAAFHTLVGTAVVNVGAAFFHETVRSLSTWLGVECVIVGELVDENRVRALAMQLDGKAIEHYEYTLPGTPCNNVAHQGYCEYPEGVCQLFPSDKELSDMGAEAYVGTSIRDKNGKAIGILCAISRHKIVSPPMLKGVFEIIAARAGTEIERKRAEDTLSESEERYRSLFENMLEGYAYCRMLFDHDTPLDFIYISVNDAFGKITGLTDVVGKKVSEVIPGIRESNPELLEIYGRIALTGQPEAFETYVDVLGIWFSITAYSPRKEHFVAVFNNITERKQAGIRLNEQVEELRRWHDVTMGREMRIIDLKREVNELLGSASQPPRYSSAE